MSASKKPMVKNREGQKRQSIQFHCYLLRPSSMFASKKPMVKNRKRKSLKAKIVRVKAELATIREQQQLIRDEQRLIREGLEEMTLKFEEIKSGCSQLKKEAEMIAKKHETNQVRLDLMFAILKARQQNNLTLANDLACCLQVFDRLVD